MSTITSGGVELTIELDVLYTFDKADPSTGSASDVDILIITLNGWEVPSSALTPKQWERIRNELRERGDE